MHVPSETMPYTVGCGNKHSVVDSDKNSAKRSTLNKQLYDVTNIMRRYFRAAGTWRGVFEPSTAASE